MIVKVITEGDKKLKIMEVCDDAYTISVIGRPNFQEIFEKIDHHAVFLGAYTEDSEIAGYAAFYANDRVERRAFISLLCVRKEMQRMHLGTALMQEMLNRAKDAGMRSIALDVLQSDEGQIRFYGSCGFEISGEGPTGFWRMERLL